VHTHNISVHVHHPNPLRTYRSSTVGMHPTQQSLLHALYTLTKMAYIHDNPPGTTPSNETSMRSTLAARISGVKKAIITSARVVRMSKTSVAALVSPSRTTTGASSEKRKSEYVVSTRYSPVQVVYPVAACMRGCKPKCVELVWRPPEQARTCSGCSSFAPDLEHWYVPLHWLLASCICRSKTVAPNPSHTATSLRDCTRIGGASNIGLLLAHIGLRSSGIAALRSCSLRKGP